MTIDWASFGVGFFACFLIVCAACCVLFEIEEGDL